MENRIISDIFKEAAQMILAAQIDVRLEQSKTLSDDDKKRVKDLYDRLNVKKKEKYISFLIKNFNEHDICELIDEFDKVTTKFDSIKNRKDTDSILKQKFDEYYKGNDINQYNIQNLREILKLTQETKTKNEEVNEMKKGGATLVAENDKVYIYHILSKEASCFYGAGTTWCTTAETNNYFKHYHSGNNLFYIVSKHRPKAVLENRRLISGDKYYKVAVLFDTKNKMTAFDVLDTTFDPSNFFKQEEIKL